MIGIEPSQILFNKVIASFPILNFSFRTTNNDNQEIQQKIIQPCQSMPSAKKSTILILIYMFSVHIE